MGSSNSRLKKTLTDEYESTLQKVKQEFEAWKTVINENYETNLMAKNVEIDTYVQSNSAYKSMISKLENDIININNENALIVDRLNETCADYIVKIDVLNHENETLRKELYKRYTDAETQVEETPVVEEVPVVEEETSVVEKETLVVEKETSVVEEETPVVEEEVPVVEEETPVIT